MQAKDTPLSGIDFETGFQAQRVEKLLLGAEKPFCLENQRN
jgi:hypothetical protein